MMSSKLQVKASKVKTRPDFSFEKAGKGFVCGLDEVGRAPVVGPVVAACVFIPKEKLKEDVWGEVNDSKMLTAAKREELFDEIRRHSCWAISEACNDEIEDMNIVQASFLAMRRAHQAMCINFNVLTSLALVDGHIAPPDMNCAVKPVIKGDTRSVSIAAASIIAKVYRDHKMKRLAAEHTGYDWENNVGYPTRKHLEGINKHGLTPYHRKTFSSVRNFIEFGTVEPQLKMAV